MTKLISTLFLFLIFFNLRAQTTDSITTGSQNINDVYYSLTSGIVKTVANTDWDLAFETSGYTGSIMANHVKGVMVWQSPFALSQWSAFDTINHNSWDKMYNNTRGWSYGAFNQHAYNSQNPFDLGWGIYDPSNNHTVTGDSIILIKLANGSFKKILIVTQTTSEYYIKYADIDGSNEKLIKIDVSTAKTKNFLYYSFATESTIDREPANTTWDLLFTKYIEFIPTPYAVAGVWTNKGVKTAQAYNTPITSLDYNSHYFSDTNTVIGYDWKTYNFTLKTYLITSDLVYFVKNAKGEVSKVFFTGYKGDPFGTYYFKRQLLLAGISKPVDLGLKLYPNPGSDLMELSIPSGQQFNNYRITDVSGKLIGEGKEIKINTSGFSPGIYYLQVETEQGTQNIKFIKVSK